MLVVPKRKLRICEIVYVLFQLAHLIAQAKIGFCNKVFFEKDSILRNFINKKSIFELKPPKLADMGKHFGRMQLAWKVTEANISLENISTS